jgi:hypothetical protein
MKLQDNYINHVVLVLDASWSMDGHTENLIKVTDAQIEYMARRSEELNQETRVSIYDFANDVRCLVYDKDVLRLPSIESIYATRGQTALIDATLKSLEDLAHTATLYGDHAFLTYVLTDGQENRSRNRPTRLKEKLRALPNNWTVAALVPDAEGRRWVTNCGFQPDNVSVWDAKSDQGVIEVGKTIRDATENFMQARSKGNFVGTRSLFSTGLEAVNAQTVRAALDPLDQRSYDIIPVHQDSPIREYIYSRGLDYQIGKGFYQLMKREKIQAQKQIAIREKATGRVYTGEAARDVLGLPHDRETTVTPNHNPEYDVFVQSTSVNRKLIRNTDVLVLR